MAFSIGDKVKFKAAFLKSTGTPADDSVWFAVGDVTEVIAGGPIPRLKVLWQDGESGTISIKAAQLVGKPEPV